MEGAGAVLDEPKGPKSPRPRLLSREDEAIILAYRWHTRLPSDVCHDRLARLMPKVSRSTFNRCLERYGLGRIGKTAITPRITGSALRGPYTFEVTADKIMFRDEVSPSIVQVFLAVEEITKFPYAEIAAHTPENAAAFLANLVADFPRRVAAVNTDIHPAFTDWHGMLGEDMAPFSSHPFAKACFAAKVAHFPTNRYHAKSGAIRTRGVEIR